MIILENPHDWLEIFLDIHVSSIFDGEAERKARLFSFPSTEREKSQALRWINRHVLKDRIVEDEDSNQYFKEASPHRTYSLPHYLKDALCRHPEWWSSPLNPEDPHSPTLLRILCLCAPYGVLFNYLEDPVLAAAGESALRNDPHARLFLLDGLWKTSYEARRVWDALWDRSIVDQQGNENDDAGRALAAVKQWEKSHKWLSADDVKAYQQQTQVDQSAWLQRWSKTINEVYDRYLCHNKKSLVKFMIDVSKHLGVDWNLSSAAGAKAFTLLHIQVQPFAVDDKDNYELSWNQKIKSWKHALESVNKRTEGAELQKVLEDLNAKYLESPSKNPLMLSSEPLCSDEPGSYSYYMHFGQMISGSIPMGWSMISLRPRLLKSFLHEIKRDAPAAPWIKSMLSHVTPTGLTVLSAITKEDRSLNKDCWDALRKYVKIESEGGSYFQKSAALFAPENRDRWFLFSDLRKGECLGQNSAVMMGVLPEIYTRDWFSNGKEFGDFYLSAYDAGSHECIKKSRQWVIDTLGNNPNIMMDLLLNHHSARRHDDMAFVVRRIERILDCASAIKEGPLKENDEQWARLGQLQDVAFKALRLGSSCLVQRNTVNSEEEKSAFYQSLEPKLVAFYDALSAAFPLDRCNEVVDAFIAKLDQYTPEPLRGGGYQAVVYTVGPSLSLEDRDEEKAKTLTAIRWIKGIFSLRQEAVQIRAQQTHTSSAPRASLPRARKT